ncbi:hypothetical protein KAR91_61065 [Candidatus Pacearchaeota archaeon]|nr:hypothetical protein [Candidatus Pacearchaeota archaeon]
MRVDLLTHDLKIAVIEDDRVSLVYRNYNRPRPNKPNYVAGVGSISVIVGHGDIANRKKIEGVVDIDPRDHFLAQYPHPFDKDANRLTLSVVKVAVTKLLGVKVIHC